MAPVIICISTSSTLDSSPGGTVTTAVADCACVAEDAGPDKTLVAAYVIPQPGEAVTPDELLAFGREHLAAYKAPKIVYLAKDFPRTRNGKILRRNITPQIATARSAA